MGIMDKAMIETGSPVRWVLPHLTIGTRGFGTTVPLTEIVECIFHRLKTGFQWRELPTRQFSATKYFTGTRSFTTSANGANRLAGSRFGSIC